MPRTVWASMRRVSTATPLAIAQRGADAMLGELIASLKAQGLDKDTDIFVTADHGFLTVSHDSKTSPSAVDGQVKNGFVAADIAAGLKLGKLPAI